MFDNTDPLAQTEFLSYGDENQNQGVFGMTFNTCVFYIGRYQCDIKGTSGGAPAVYTFNGCTVHFVQVGANSAPSVQTTYQVSLVGFGPTAPDTGHPVESTSVVPAMPSPAHLA